MTAPKKNFGPYDKKKEVTFVSPGAQVAIRLTENTTDAMCKAARDLGARYFIAVDGWSELTGSPVWGVFDMRTAQKDNPMPGTWSINDPVRTFPYVNLDAAVMYAVTLLSMRQ